MSTHSIRGRRRIRGPGRVRPRKLKLGRASRKTIKQIVRGLMEPKYSYEYSTGFEVYTTAAVTDLTDAITQGDGVNNREGDVVQLTSLVGRSEIAAKSTAAAGTLNNVKHILFIWHPDDSADAPTASKVLYDAVTLPYLSPLALDKAARKKFTVLHHANHVLATRAEGGADAVATDDFAINLTKYPPVQFNRGATSGKHKLYMLVLGNQATGVNSATMTYYFGLKFKEAN